MKKIMLVCSFLAFAVIGNATTTMSLQDNTGKTVQSGSPQKSEAVKKEKKHKDGTEHAKKRDKKKHKNKGSDEKTTSQQQ